MNDLERDLRQMFVRHEVDVAGPVLPPTRLVAKVRRRQLTRVSSVALVAIALVVVAIGLTSRDRADQQAPDLPVSTGTPLAPDRPAPQLGTVTLGDLNVTVPPGWFLNASGDGWGNHSSSGLGPVIWLSNFPAPLTSPDPCTGMPQDGVILVIEPATNGTKTPAWPVDLAQTSDPVLGCGTSEANARWSWNGHGVAAMAAFGATASGDDRRTLETAFGKLSAAAPVIPFDPSPYCPGTPGGVNASEIVSGGLLNGRPWTLLVTPTCTGIGVATSGNESTASLFDGLDDPHALNITTLNVRDDTYVYGVVPSDAARVVVEPAGAGPITASLAPLGTMHAFGAAVDGIRTGTITSFDASGAALSTVHFWPLMDCSNAQTCGRTVAPGETIAQNDPADASVWMLREVNDSVVLTGSGGTVLARTDASPTILSASRASLPGGGAVVFGVVRPGASLPLVHAPATDHWYLASMVPLTGGRSAFWFAPGSGPAADLVAAVDPQCNVLTTIDVASGDAVQGPPRLSWCQQQ